MAVRRLQVAFVEARLESLPKENAEAWGTTSLEREAEVLGLGSNAARAGFPPPSLLMHVRGEGSRGRVFRNRGALIFFSGGGGGA